MKNIGKLLRSIDIYGKKADLSMNREEAYKTVKEIVSDLMEGEMRRLN